MSDDELFIELVHLLLSNFSYTIHLARQPDETSDLITQQQPSLVLVDLDMDMENNSVLHTAQHLRMGNKQLPILVFTSRYTEEVYMNCRNFTPSSFMSKELSGLTLRQALDAAITSKPTTPVFTAPPPVVQKHKATHYFFRIGLTYQPLALKDICYFFAENKMVYAKMTDGTLTPISTQLKKIEEDIGEFFIRIHKTYIVNISQVETITPSDNAVVVGGDTLPVSNLYRKAFLQRLRILK